MHLHYHQVLGLFSLLVLLPSFISAISYCGGPCNNMNDCNGQLICHNGICDDDPDVGTHICGGSGGGDAAPSTPSDGSCQPSGSKTCPGKEPKPTYDCSPPVTSSTPAKLTNNDFSEGGDGGGSSKCDNSYHENTEPIVALSTGWYNDNGGTRCGRMISITAKNGKTTTAKVVDECDSRNGCDAEHAYQGPCDNNVVDGSNAVWEALELDISIGVEDITWSMA